MASGLEEVVAVEGEDAGLVRLRHVCKDHVHHSHQHPAETCQRRMLQLMCMHRDWYRRRGRRMHTHIGAEKNLKWART